MRKRTRRILFWLAVVIFGLVTWVALQYAQGYVFDVATGHFVRTGALAATVNTSATLFVNDQDVGSTSLLGNRAGKNRLTPGTYLVRVARDGYSSWQKTVIVQEGLLTDFPHVLIEPTDAASQAGLQDEASRSLGAARTLKNAVPKLKPPQVRVGDFLLKNDQLWDMRTASGSLMATGVLGFTPTDDGSRILWWTNGSVWVQWLSATNDQPYRVENERQNIVRLSASIVRAGWFHDNDHIVVDLGNHNYRVIETDTRGGTNSIKI
jgi:hypothetical protein